MRRYFLIPVTLALLAFVFGVQVTPTQAQVTSVTITNVTGGDVCAGGAFTYTFDIVGAGGGFNGTINRQAVSPVPTVVDTFFFFGTFNPGAGQMLGAGLGALNPQPANTIIEIFLEVDGTVSGRWNFNCSNVTGTAAAGVFVPPPGGGGGGGTPVPLVNFVDPDGDEDGDGVRNAEDNCLNEANPSQEDGWGGDSGDACDTGFYNTNIGVLGFPQKDGTFDIYGNCGSEICDIVASFSPAALRSNGSEPSRFQTPTGAGWYVDVFYLGLDDAGNAVYQANVYDAGGVLIDDRLEIFVFGDNTWLFQQRGGDALYNALVPIMDPANTSAAVGGTGAQVQAVGNVRIRQEPSTDGLRLGYVPWGEIVSVVGIDESGNWLLIEYNGIRGWTASGWYITLDGAPISVAAAAEERTVVDVIPPNGARAVGHVRIRTGPSVDATYTGFQVPWGAVVTVLTIEAEGEWYQISYQGIVGYVASAWFIPGSSLVPGPDDVSIEGVVVVDVGNATSFANVRLRTGPNLDSDYIGIQVPWGGRVNVLGIDESGNWYLLNYQGVTAWAASAFFRMDEVIEEG